MSGVVTNTQMQPVQGASVIAIHEPSGTTYEAITRADGRFAIQGMRVGSPYSVTKDVNGIYYINANLPAAQSAFAGVDNRPRWVGPACVNLGNPGGCSFRINSEPGNVVGVNYVLKNGNEGTAWNIAQSLSKATSFGLSMRGAYSYGVASTISDPESSAATSFARSSHAGDPNDPGKRLAVVNNELIRNTLQSSATPGDVWQFMLSLRYNFN